MKIKLNWYKPIELGSSSVLRDRLKNFNFSDIPEIAGIYIFYRQTRSGKQEALYVGQSLNIRTRFKQHCDSLKLIEGLENTPQGKKMFIFSEARAGRADIEKVLEQAERGYIQYFLDNNHPLINKLKYEDKYDEISSTGDGLIELVSDEIYVYSK